MAPTFCLLTLIAGQSTPAPAAYSQTYASPQYQSGDCNCQNGQYGQYPQASGGLFSRVRGWFRGPDRCAERPGLVNRVRDWRGSSEPVYANNGYRYQGTQMQPTPYATVQGQPARPVMAQGRPNMDQTREPELARPLTQTTNFRPQQTPRTEIRAGKINEKFVNKIGHEDDYSWITGQLDQENGKWIIRYATPETVDRFKGQIVLAPGANVSQLRPGDLVSATGQVIGQGSAVIYRVATINLIERD